MIMKTLHAIYTSFAKRTAIILTLLLTLGVTSVWGAEYEEMLVLDVAKNAPTGSTTTAMATNIMKDFGVDSKFGIISSCIMGATETTIYVATLYSSKVKVKNISEVICIRIIS